MASVLMGLFVGIYHGGHGGHGGGEKRGDENQSFWMIRNALVSICLLCSLCPRWLNFLVGWGFVFEEAFLAK
jgi:hypothetical protein